MIRIDNGFSYRRKTMSNKLYDTLKYITQIGLPAVAAFYAALAYIWHWPYAEEVVATITALVTLLSSFLGISSARYNSKQEAEEEEYYYDD